MASIWRWARTHALEWHGCGPLQDPCDSIRHNLRVPNGTQPDRARGPRTQLQGGLVHARRRNRERLASDSMSYLWRLAARTRSVGSVLCVGMDPQFDALPDGFGRDLPGIEGFCEVLLESTLPYAAAVKPNVAFFEVFGSAGIAALERLRRRVPSDVPFVADVKRGDIGTTA